MSSAEEYHLYRLNEHLSEPINVTAMINGKQFKMELDTAAAMSIISDHTRRTLFPELKEAEGIRCRPQDIYRGAYGSCWAAVKYGSQEEMELVKVPPTGLGEDRIDPN